MRRVYLPNTGPAALSRAMYCVSYAVLIKFHADRGVDLLFDPRFAKLRRAFDLVEMLWPFALVFEPEEIPEFRRSKLPRASVVPRRRTT